MGRWVIKVGSSSLSSLEGGLDLAKLNHIVDQIAAVRSLGIEVVLVSSGAVAAGFQLLGLSRRPQSTAEKQAAASIGQGLLIEEYSHRFILHGITVAQVLLTRSDFAARVRFNNAQNTLSLLLRRGILPIVNENDTVSVEELTFGDNDRLSALVAGLIHADLLVILSDIEGLYDADPRRSEKGRLIPYIQQITPEIEALAGESHSPVGTGGMRSKLEAAKVAMASGISVFLGHAQTPNLLARLAREERVPGTFFGTAASPLSVRKQWLWWHAEPAGKLLVDGGAAEALREKGKSLLASGLVAVEGEFGSGNPVSICSVVNGQEIARGTTPYDSHTLRQMVGLSTPQIVQRFGRHEPVVHRDHMALTPGAKVNHRP